MRNTAVDSGIWWGNWHVESLVGQGAFGAVYKIYRENFDKKYYAAAKIVSIPQSESEIRDLKAEGMTEEEITRYFQTTVKNLTQEVDLMEALKGVSGIVSIEDYQIHEKEDGIGWNIIFRMEYLTGIYEYLGERVMSEPEVVWQTAPSLDILNKEDIVKDISENDSQAEAVSMEDTSIKDTSREIPLMEEDEEKTVAAIDLPDELFCKSTK